jgi:hypothetical protein
MFLSGGVRTARLHFQGHTAAAKDCLLVAIDRIDFVELDVLFKPFPS